MAEEEDAPAVGSDWGDEQATVEDAALAVQGSPAAAGRPPAWAEAARRRDLLILRTLQEDPGWIWRSVIPRLQRDPDSGCLLWTGALSNGYGMVSLSVGGSARIHRVTYVHATGGPVPFGLTLDHVRARGCIHRNCAEPSHLEAVPMGENTLRGDTVTADNARRTHCPRGHPLEGDNLVQSALARGWRKCRTCADEHDAAISAAHRGLGLTKDSYATAFDQSRRTAEQVLAALESGVPAEDIIRAAERGAA